MLFTRSLALSFLTSLLIISFSTRSLGQTEVSGNIVTDQTWTIEDSPYLIVEDLTVVENVTLTIEAGVVVKFDYVNVSFDFGHKMEVYGGFQSLGTAENPVVFTSERDDSEGGDSNGDGNSTQPAPGDWASIQFFANPNIQNTIQHCKFKYGGNDYQSANDYMVLITKDNENYDDPTIQNCSFQNATGDALRISGLGEPQVIDCEFSDNSVGVKFVGNSQTALRPLLNGNNITGCSIPLAQYNYAFPDYQNNAISDNDNQVIAVQGQINPQSSAEENLINLEIPYLVNGTWTLQSNFSLTIEAGVVVKFDYVNVSFDFGHKMEVYGGFQSLGTAENPVVFTSERDDSEGGDSNGDGNSTQPAPGDWASIQFFANPNIQNTIQHCKFKYGGNDYQSANDYMVLITKDNENYDDPTIQNCSFQNATGDALRISGLGEPQVIDCEFSDNSVGVKFVGNSQTALRPLLNGNNITGCSIPLAQYNYAFPDYQNNAISDNDNQVIAVQGQINPQSSAEENLINLEIPYLVNGTWTLQSNFSLTIEAGVVVKFDYVNVSFDFGHKMEVYGGFQSLGTAENPVVFTSERDDSEGGDSNGDGNSTQPAPGDWASIQFFANPNIQNTIQHCKFKYGGNDYQSANDYMVLITKDNENYDDPTIQNCSFQNATGDALRISGLGEPQVIDCEFSDNSVGVKFVGNSQTALRPLLNGNNITGCSIPLAQYNYAFPDYQNNAISDNDNQVIAVQGQINPQSSAEENLINLEIPYLVNGTWTLQSNFSLTIEAGVVVKFDYVNVSFDFGHKMEVYGGFQSLGTAENPVVFTSERDDSEGGDSNGDGNSTQPAPGDWASIQFFANPNIQNTIQHCKFKYGGNDYQSANDYMVLITKDNENYDDPTIQNCSFQNATGDALRISGLGEPQVIDCEFSDNSVGVKFVGNSQTALRPLLNGNNITGCSIPLAQYNYAFPDYQNNAISDNDNQVIAVQGQINPQSSAEENLINLEIPYLVNGTWTLQSNFSLTIEAGVVVKFDYVNVSFDFGHKMEVYGGFQSLGTAENPVVFTSERDDSEGGDSNGDGNSTQPAPGDWASIQFFANPNIQNTIQHCKFKYGGNDYQSANDYMVLITKDNENYDDPTIQNCSFQNATGDALRISGLGEPQVIDCEFSECNQFALNNITGNIVNAENNYWNSNLGPTHESNPDGDGEEVSDNVDFEPWLTQASGPTITTQPEPALTLIGGTFSLSVVAQGLDLQYQWRKNGVNVDNGNSSVLTIDNTTFEDAGTYNCEVSNSTETLLTESVEVSVADISIEVGPAFGPGSITGAYGEPYLNYYPIDQNRMVFRFDVSSATDIENVAFAATYDGLPVEIFFNDDFLDVDSDGLIDEIPEGDTYSLLGISQVFESSQLDKELIIMATEIEGFTIDYSISDIVSFGFCSNSNGDPFDLFNDAYSFGNTSSGLTFFDLFNGTYGFSDEQPGNALFTDLYTNNGRCYGYAASAGSFFLGQEVAPLGGSPFSWESPFDESGQNASIEEIINDFHKVQMRFDPFSLSSSSYAESINEIKEEILDGNPVVLKVGAIEFPDIWNTTRHAVLATKFTEFESLNSTAIQVYESNFNGMLNNEDFYNWQLEYIYDNTNNTLSTWGNYEQLEVIPQSTFNLPEELTMSEFLSPLNNLLSDIGFKLFSVACPVNFMVEDELGNQLGFDENGELVQTMMEGFVHKIPTNLFEGDSLTIIGVPAENHYLTTMSSFDQGFMRFEYYNPISEQTLFTALSDSIELTNETTAFFSDTATFEILVDEDSDGTIDNTVPTIENPIFLSSKYIAGIEFKIYPNPVKAVLNLRTSRFMKLDGVEYSILKINGQEVQTGRFLNRPMIEVSNLLSGQYVLILKQAGVVMKSVPFIKN